MNQRQFCYLEAYEKFREAIPDLETNDGLLRAAVAIAQHEDRKASYYQVDLELDHWATEARAHVRSDNPQALLAHLHHYLFDQLNLQGNSRDYYRASNSYINVVMEQRIGIPISLTLVYKLVAERIGLSVDGINAPGHFFARVTYGSQESYVDPFREGTILSVNEAREYIESIVGHSVGQQELLAVASHRVWINRMLNNLRTIFAHQGRERDQAAMEELTWLLLHG